MSKKKEINFREYREGLVGRQGGMMFIIQTEPGVIAGTPAHWVSVVLEDGRFRFSIMEHQYFHLNEAKEFCRQVAAGKVDLAELQKRYDEEDEVRLQEVREEISERVALFRARLTTVSLAYPDLVELVTLYNRLGEEGQQILLNLERGEALEAKKPADGESAGTKGIAEP